MIDTIPDDKYYSSGQQIACTKCDPPNWAGLCAFTQKMGTTTVAGWYIKEKMKNLKDHGCTDCGSVPIYPGNDVNKGGLTVNWVHKGCG